MRTIPDFLLSQAAANPARSALLTTGGDSLSYNARVAEIALHLRSLGIKPTDAVAVVMPPGPAMAISFLAVSSVAACAPLNPAYRRSDFEFYLSDLRPAAMLVPADFASPCIEVAAELAIPVVRLLLSPEGWIEVQGARNPDAHAELLRGEISPQRYDSYLRLRDELEEQYVY